MKSSPDPSIHRIREQQFIEHVLNLLDDPRLRLDTINGHRAVSSLQHGQPNRTDHGTDLKRIMSEMNVPDRDLQSRMPIGEQMELTLSQRKMIFFKQAVGRLRVLCVSPVKALLRGETPKPMTTQEITKLMSELPPSLGGLPTTVVLLSTGGFTLEAHEAAERRPDRTLVLVEPNDAGGWSVYGPPETKGLVDLFDPEAEEAKRQRVRDLIEQSKVELMSGGIATDKLAAKAQLPLQLIESELKSYAQANPGLAARRLDGRVVLFRQGNSPATSAGAKDMPLIDRIKTLFSRKGETEKKIAVLSEQKAAFAQQLDRAYDEIGTLEKRDTELRDDFKAATGVVTKRRITSQLVQLRKDIDRRQQLIGVLNQRINVVATHLHNLELVRSDETAKLPDSEEIANDAAAAEEMLAQLQADHEVAESVGAIAHAGMTDEEQALFEELERDATGGVSIPDPVNEKIIDAPPPQSVIKPQAAPQRRPAEPEAS